MKKTLADFQPLKPAEQELLRCCQSGEVAVIGEKRPTEKTEENEIRAAFIRWLILTKETEIDPKGIQFKRGWISGSLDLEHVHCLHVLSFFHSVFEEVILLRGASTKSIHMDGSLCKKGIHADGLFCHGNLNLRKGFESEDEVRFLVARIEGEFDCSNAKFKALNGNENVLSCDGINVEGAVSLDNSYFENTVRFVGAKIRSNFDCIRAIFQAMQEEKKALCCDSMTVHGGLILRKNCKILKGTLDLSNVTVGAFGDDADFWKSTTLNTIKLDGLQYRHIYGDTSASFRLQNMLDKMLEFRPQPYRQLAKVLRDMGHDRDADEVMIALNDKRLAAQIKVSFQKKINNLKKEFIVFYLIRIIGALTSYIFRKVYKWTSAYGYRPMRIFGIMIFVWLSCGLIYDYSAKRAVFAPSNPLVFQNQEYNCTIDKSGTKWFSSLKDYNASNNWYEASPPEYTTFQPFWYSLDIILPVVDLKMEKDWGVVIPSPDGSFFKTFNYFVRFLTWSENIIGWILSLLLVAILSGLAKNEKE